MNESKRKPIATIALAAFVLLISACSGAESDSAALAKAPADVETTEPADDVAGQVESQVQGITEQVEEQVQSITEGASIKADEAGDTPAGQRFEIVGVPRGLNLRTGPGVGYEIITGIEKDRIVVGSGTEQDSWTEVSIDGNTGWVSSIHLQPTEAVDNPVELESTAEAVVTRPVIAEGATTDLVVVNVPAGLNLRAGPGVGYDIVGGATLGTSVTATGQSSQGWVEVEHVGVVGWASETHLAQG